MFYLLFSFFEDLLFFWRTFILVVFLFESLLSFVIWWQTDNDQSYDDDCLACQRFRSSAEILALSGCGKVVLVASATAVHEPLASAIFLQN